MTTITIIENTTGHPADKLADAEVHFTRGQLAGLKLVGFGIWRSDPDRDVHVSFPGRAYSVNGERRSFQLLRPRTDDEEPRNALVERIREAYRKTCASRS